MGRRAGALTLATLIAFAGLVARVGPAGAVTGSLDASCVTLSGSIPIGRPTIRSFGYESHAPDTVAPGATFAVPISIAYTVPLNADDGIAQFVINGHADSGSGFAVPGGESSIHGSLLVTAPDAIGDHAVVTIARFGALKVAGGSAISEVCTPLHTTVVASVGVGVPLVSIGDAAVVEGSSGTRALEFAVSLSRPATTTVTVAFDTEDGTATAGSDYVAQSGSVTFQPGLVSALATIPVRVRGDRTVEPKENFRVRLHDPVGAVLGRAVGTGRIIDDDPGAGLRLSVGDASVVEGARGTRSARFTVSLSAPATQRVTFHFSASDGSAVLGKDYRNASYDGVINPGSTSTTWPVPVVPNGTPDGNRTFAVHLTGVTGAAVGRANGVGTIIDDD